jgi:DNA-binding beta-propeller fold protein YncE
MTHPPRAVALVAFALGVSNTPSALVAQPVQRQELQLVTKIPLGDVRGRIDHMAVDLSGQHVFVAELGNNSVSAVDLQQAKVLHRITGLNEPQGVGYVPATGTLYVANGGDGSIRFFQGSNYAEAGRIALGDDADNVRFDRAGKSLFIGYGNGGLAVIDVTRNQQVGTIALKAHPESFQLSATGGKIFVNVPRAREIALVDRTTRKQTASWHMNQSGNFPMALDDAEQRVIAVFRSPARLGVFSAADGKSVASLETCGDADDVFIDAKRHRVYVACGAGSIDVFESEGARYRPSARIPTVAGARTALFIPELDRLVVAARTAGSAPASLWVFRPTP